MNEAVAISGLTGIISMAAILIVSALGGVLLSKVESSIEREHH